MDPKILELAQKIGTFLLPFLPYLLKIGDKAAEEIGKKIGGEAWEKAKALWGKLRPRIEAKPAAQQAVQEAAADPQDAAKQEALMQALAQVLQEETFLQDKVTTIVSDLQVEAVRKGGKVTGVWVTTPKGRMLIRSKVEAGDVSGEVTGVRYEG